MATQTISAALVDAAGGVSDILLRLQGTDPASRVTQLDDAVAMSSLLQKHLRRARREGQDDPGACVEAAELILQPAHWGLLNLQAGQHDDSPGWDVRAGRVANLFWRGCQLLEEAHNAHTCEQAR